MSGNSKNLSDITVKLLEQQTYDRSLFEYDLHEFHCPEEFALICWNVLPGRLADSHPGCVMLCLSLAQMHSAWLKDALFDARKERNLELLQKKTNVCLSMAEENSKVNRFLGCAFFSSTKRYSGVLSTHVNCKEVLLSMMMCAREIDDEYIEKYYDSHMAFSNRGGLTVVEKTFLEWGKILLSKITGAYFLDVME